MGMDEYKNKVGEYRGRVDEVKSSSGQKQYDAASDLFTDLAVDILKGVGKGIFKGVSFIVNTVQEMKKEEEEKNRLALQNIANSFAEIDLDKMMYDNEKMAIELDLSTYLLEEDYNKIITYALEALEKFPKEASIYCYLGRAYRRKNQNDKAIEVFMTGTVIDPEYYENYIELAEIYVELGDNNKSRICYYEGIRRMKPESDWDYRNRAELYEIIEEYAKAVEDYKKAISMSDNTYQWKLDSCLEKLALTNKNPCSQEVNNGDSFLFVIEDLITIQGRGIIATGEIQKGSIKINQQVEIADSQPLKVITVTGIDGFNMLFDEAKAGDNVGLLLKGIKKTDLKKGQKLIRH